MRLAEPNAAAKASWDQITEILNAAETTVMDVGVDHPSALSAEEKAAIIADLNHHENEVCRAQAIFLKAVGYTGPVGKMLE